MESSEPHHAAYPPTLRTLGALQMAGSPVTRPKPLLVLAYLAHEGPTDRDQLARLFFASSRDARDALGTTIRRLEGLGEPVGPSDGRVRASVTTDALEFQQLAVSGAPQVALARYRGSFLQGAPMGCGVEVDDWILSTREHFGSVARDLHLDLVRRELDRDRAVAAWHHAQRAIALSEAFVLEPEPSVLALQELSAAGLRVPERWWRALAALGFDRPRPDVPETTPRSLDHVQKRDDGGGHAPSVRRRMHAPRITGVRKPRRLTERP